MSDFNNIGDALKYLYAVESELLVTLSYCTEEEAFIVVSSLIQVSCQIVSLKILDGSLKGD